MKTSPILLTGANGFVGRALCVELAKRGDSVCGAIRTPDEKEVEGCELVRISNVDSSRHMVGKTAKIERLPGSLQVDSGKIRRELDWIPPYTLQQGLQATAEWYRNSRL